jgi:hypothetical protein
MSLRFFAFNGDPVAATIPTKLVYNRYWYSHTHTHTLLGHSVVDPDPYPDPD